VRTKLDLEMAATKEILAVALKVRPELATFVPERRRELTTEGGLDVAGDLTRIRRAVGMLQDRGIAVSLFVDPVRKQIDACRETGAMMIEIHTGRYADAATAAAKKKHLGSIKRAAAYAGSLGLGVNAGHGLNYRNVVPVAAIAEIGEMSIGHAVIARALEVGMERAVKEMRALIKKAGKR